MKISIVVPVFNEEKSLDGFLNEFLKFKEIASVKGYEANALFVDDGSKDRTAFALRNLVNKNNCCSAIFLSRNFGKEAALFAGLEHASGDLIVPMDVDLQDPFDLIFEMITAYENGAQVVLARRINRDSDSFLKRFSARMFYKLNNKMSTFKIEENVGDFRLMTRQVVDEIINLQENQLFMKGLMSWVGFETAIVDYVRPIRKDGESKFNYTKLWNLAIQGITSFSTLPLKIWTYFGSVIAVISFLYGLKIIVEKVCFGIEVSGYASLMVAVLFFGGVQLIGIGVLGEYVGRIFMESKRRPKYIIKHKLNIDDK